MRITFLFACTVFACAEPAPPSADDVGREVRHPPPRRIDEGEQLYDARGVPLESGERVAGLTLPRGLTAQPALSTERRHVYVSSIPRERLLRYFGPRLTTMNIREDGEVVTYVDAAPREARGGIVKLDVTILPSSAHGARVEIYERPPEHREAPQVSEETIRRHLDGLTKNRE